MPADRIVRDVREVASFCADLEALADNDHGEKGPPP